MSFSKFWRSFGIGFQGLAHALRAEQNMRIHGVVALGVVAAGWALSLAAWEWVALVFCIGLVLSAECMNTALERLADRISPESHPLIKQAKDCSSAAVLVLALASAIVGALVLGPKLWTAAGW